MKIPANNNNSSSKAMVTMATTTATGAAIGEPLVLDHDLLNIWEMSEALARAAYSTPPGDDAEELKELLDLQQLEIFQDVRVDVTVSSNMVAKHNDICYGAFRGTELSSQDWAQNLNLAPDQVGECSVHGGMNNNYVLADKPGFDAALQSCLDSCEDDDCPLVFTGHSQGGATAVIAQLYWNEYDPLVVTYGAPAAVYTPDCMAINPHKNHRFWNTQSIDGSLTYDVVNNLNIFGTHYGHALLMSADQPEPVYLGFNDNSKRRMNSVRAHSGYQERMQALVEQADTLNLPIRLDEAKLSKGSSCGDNDECESGKCDIFGSCASSKKENGDFCNEDSDCKSDICAIGFGLGLCTSGTRGDRCVRDDDCLSDSCSWFFTCRQ